MRKKSPHVLLSSHDASAETFRPYHLCHDLYHVLAQSRQAWDGRPSPSPCENIMTWTVGTIHYDMSPLRSVLRSGRRKMNVERPVLRLWYPKMTRFTFRVPKINVERSVLRSGRPKRERVAFIGFGPSLRSRRSGARVRPPRSVGQDVRTVFWQLLLSLLRKDRGPGPVHGVSRT